MNRFLLLFVPVMAVGQSVPMNATVRACIDAAVSRHPSMQLAEARRVAADARVDETSAARLPQVRLNARYAQLSEVDAMTISLPVPGFQPITLFPSINHQSSVRLSVTQPIFTGFRISGAIDASKSGAMSAAEEALRDRNDLVLQVEHAYWTWVQAIEASEVLQAALKQLTEHERIVQRIADQGLLTTSDVLNVRVKKSDVNVKLIDARTNATLAMMSLNNLMGNPLEAPLVPSERPLDSVMVQSSEGTDALITRAMSSRPDLRVLELRREMAEAFVTSAESGWYPQVALAAGYDYARPNPRVIPPKDVYKGTWDIGVTLQWNVWDWMTTSSQTIQAKAAVRQAEAGIEQMANVVRLEVRQHARRVNDSRELVAAAQIGLKAAQESRRVVGEKFDRGTASTTDVLDAEVALLQAGLALTRAGAELRLNDARLRRAVGERS